MGARGWEYGNGAMKITANLGHTGVTTEAEGSEGALVHVKGYEQIVFMLCECGWQHLWKLMCSYQGLWKDLSGLGNIAFQTRGYGIYSVF